ncbi:MAG: tail fiber domain-containing protein [Chitinophagaceae bacterium]|nr:tail fiber domain-containing protein [Chitinophagaceae bacterium]
MTKSILLIGGLLFLGAAMSFGQNVGINQTGVKADASAMLDVSSPNKGLLIPRVDLTDKYDNVTIASPAATLLVYNIASNDKEFPQGPGYYYNANVKNEGDAFWVRLLDSEFNTPWLLGGNNDIDAAIHFVGSTNAADVVFKRGEVEGVRLAQGGAMLATGSAVGGITPAQGAGRRLMWIPAKAAFRAGEVTNANWDNANVGLRSFAGGYNTVASGEGSTAMGRQTTASGSNSTAMGRQTTASGQNSTAMGSTTTAFGVTSTAMGSNTVASGDTSTAMGQQTIASGQNSTAMGSITTASGEISTAMGRQTTAFGKRSTAMGNNTTASGDNSTAMGSYTKAEGLNSTAMGFRTTVTPAGTNSTAMGSNTTASDQNSTAMGEETIASGFVSTAMGSNTIAEGTYSTAMGFKTTASGSKSTAMGEETIASGEKSTAMGFKTTASGYHSTAMGRNTIASGDTSTAMGFKTTASGLVSTAMGRSTTAYGFASTAMGWNTTAEGDQSTAMGSSTTASGFRSTAMGYNTTAYGPNSTAMGFETTASGEKSTAMGEGTIAFAERSTAMGYNTKANAANSFTSGQETIANVTNSSAFGIGTIASARHSMVVGLYNDVLANPSPNASAFTDRIFQVGGGSGPSNAERSNALTVLRSGRTAVGKAHPIAMLDITKSLHDQNYKILRLADVNKTAHYEVDIINIFGQGPYMEFSTNADMGRYIFTNNVYKPGNNNPDQKPYLMTIAFNGEVYIAGTLHENSDIRLKKNIRPLENVLYKVNNIQPITYYFKDTKNHPASHQIGFNAQELQKQFPQLVSEDINKDLSVNYTHVSGSFTSH